MAQQFWDNVQDLFGNALPQAVVTVTNYPDGSLATLFQDYALTIPLANPFVLSSITGATGIAPFYADNGPYSIRVSDRGITLPYQRVVTLYDPNLDPNLQNQSVPSIAALQGLFLANIGGTVVVQGYAVPGDGGGGTFVWNPASGASDNGGTIIVDAAGRRWYRIFTGAIQLAWFGADATGGVDATIAIRTAATAAKAADVGLVFGAGQFVTSGSLDFTSTGDNFYVEGQGQVRTTITCTANNIPIVLLGGSGLGGTGRFNHMRGFTLAFATPQTTGMSLGACLSGTGTQTFSCIGDLYLQNGYRCLDYGGAQNASQFNNIFYNIRMENPYWSFMRLGNANGGSSGSTYIDLYMSGTGRDSINYMMELIDFNSGEFSRLNTERTTIRSSAILTTGSDNIIIDGWNTEELSIIGSGTTTFGSDGALALVPTFLNTSARGNVKIRNFLATSCQVGPQVVTSLTVTAGVSTATISGLGLQQKLATSTHGCRVGDTITVAGASDAGYNAVWTVTAVTATTVSWTQTGSPLSPATPASGADYITLQLGGSTYGSFSMLSTSGLPGNFEWDGMYFRQSIVTGATGALRQNMLRPAGGSVAGTVKISNISMAGTSALPATWHTQKVLAGYSRVSATSIATLYFTTPHRLFGAGTTRIKVVGATDTTFNGIFTVATIVDDFTITISNAGTDKALTRDQAATTYLVLTTTTNIAVVGTVCTVTTAVAHGLSLYDRIALNSTDNPTVNTVDAAVLTIPTTTTFTIATTASAFSAADVTGIVQYYECGFAQTAYSAPNSTLMVNAIKELDWLFQGGAIIGTGNITTGSSTTLNTTVYGALPGDFYAPGFTAQPTAGLVVVPYSSALNTATFAVQNPTAGSLALALQFVKYKYRRD